VRFFDAGMLQMTSCGRCTGKFVAHKHDLQNNVVCGACQPPSRAGKTKKAAAARQAVQEAALEVVSGKSEVPQAPEHSAQIALDNVAALQPQRASLVAQAA
jgi:flagellar transcriptional activator FlhC